jgi:hypothetical protein
MHTQRTNHRRSESCRVSRRRRNETRINVDALNKAGRSLDCFGFSVVICLFVIPPSETGEFHCPAILAAPGHSGEKDVTCLWKVHAVAIILFTLMLVPLMECDARLKNSCSRIAKRRFNGILKSRVYKNSENE